ncbi:response regulator [soil metagenome]
MKQDGTWSEKAVILAPSGRDAEIAATILGEAGFPSQIVRDLPSMIEQIELGAGVAVMAEEAIRSADLRPFKDSLDGQPAWSDIPVVLLTWHGGGPERNPAASRLAEVLGNVTFLERPFHPTTLATLARTAIRSRRRQYEARSRLEDLAEGEQRLQTALRAGRFGSWILDVEHEDLTCSDTCRSNYGLPADTPFTYADLRGIVFPDDQARWAEAIDTSIATGADLSVEYRNVWPDGSIHWVDVRGRCVLDDAGRVRSMVGVSADITARRAAELERENLLADLAVERTALSELTRTLEQRVESRTHELMTEVSAREHAQDQLRQVQKMESIGQLTGGVAHDFNNLLMAVLGNLQLLRKRLPDDPRMKRLVDGAMQGAERGASLTQRLLAFSRQQDLKTDAVDLGALLVGMDDLLERSLGPQVSLEWRIEPGLPPALVDANQLELAILNLTINARDAMPDGGTITITLDQDHRDDGSTPEFLRMQIADSGSGMDADTLARAVEPFFSTKPVGKGTGLGLSMVHGLATQLGGRLELDSTPGVGTTVTLCLPISEHRAGTLARSEEPQPTPTGRTATILFVDDDPLIASSTVDML